ncbi:collagen, type I, alpha 1b-like [Oryctolagus cuniculus]|uniref:collagen, type I, alpha 1b-like n=1 Tax=Oryctolagus cuniculus TaxID=9986 RepID=UPI0038799117
MTPASHPCAEPSPGGSTSAEGRRLLQQRTAPDPPGWGRAAPNLTPSWEPAGSARRPPFQAGVGGGRVLSEKQSGRAEARGRGGQQGPNARVHHVRRGRAGSPNQDAGACVLDTANLFCLEKGARRVHFFFFFFFFAPGPRWQVRDLSGTRADGDSGPRGFSGWDGSWGARRDPSGAGWRGPQNARNTSPGPPQSHPHTTLPRRRFCPRSPGHGSVAAAPGAPNPPRAYRACALRSHRLASAEAAAASSCRSHGVSNRSPLPLQPPFPPFRSSRPSRPGWGVGGTSAWNHGRAGAEEGSWAGDGACALGRSWAGGREGVFLEAFGPPACCCACVLIPREAECCFSLRP